jgi:hypothetical protein
MDKTGSLQASLEYAIQCIEAVQRIECALEKAEEDGGWNMSLIAIRALMVPK